MLLLFTYLSLICLANSYTFITTEQFYNGTTGYNGLFVACNRMHQSSRPCTVIQLLNRFWMSKTLHRSWILALDVNCVGYTTNATEALGTCIVPSFQQLTMCSCNMLMPICCYY